MPGSVPGASANRTNPSVPSAACSPSVYAASMSWRTTSSSPCACAGPPTPSDPTPTDHDEYHLSSPLLARRPPRAPAAGHSGHCTAAGRPRPAARRGGHQGPRLCGGPRDRRSRPHHQRDGGRRRRDAGRPPSQCAHRHLLAQAARRPVSASIRGMLGNSGVTFSIRADQVWTGAKLKINYAYSPSLIPQLSHINVMVNEQVAATIPVPTEQAGQNLQREVIIPPRLITEFNRLNLELIGHYTRDCEDPTHSSLWANVGNDSVLELTLTPIAQANDLALLPQPFFDRRDALPLALPMVFAGTPAPPPWKRLVRCRPGSAPWPATVAPASPRCRTRSRPKAMPSCSPSATSRSRGA